MPLEIAPTDMELMTSMIQKIALLEQKVKSQACTIQQKVKISPTGTKSSISLVPIDC